LQIFQSATAAPSPAPQSGADDGFIHTAVSNALRANQRMLSEAASKRVLGHLGFRVIEGRLVQSRAAAAHAAIELGYPVVLKASGASIGHKTDLGLIYKDLLSRTALVSAYKKISAELERHSLLSSLDGILVEKCASPGAEMILGFRRDPSFGPMVMLGTGGIFTELVRDVSFALAPVNAQEVWRMLRRLRLLSALAGGQRGLPDNDLAAVVRAVLALAGRGGFALAVEEFREIDINPLRVYPDGYCILDAKIYLEAAAKEQKAINPTSSETEILSRFQPLFYPKSAAYVGASPTSGNMVTRMMQASRSLGFEGSFYPIHPKADAVEGWRCYRSLAELPETVDFACIGVAGENVPHLLASAAGKVKFAHVLSSGFSELGEDGRRLEENVLSAAKTAGIRILGPNCMGLHCPEGKITCIDHASSTVGRVAFVSQSGGFGTDAIRRANALGLCFSKVVTVGNSIDLECIDFMEFFAADPGTDAVLVYVESFKDGRRFFDACRAAAKRKPLFVLRGGLSLQGSRAAEGHTGRLSGGREEWLDLLSQAGAVAVDSFEELLNAGVVAQQPRLPKGSRILLCGQGGGASVVATDLAAGLGLKVPPLDSETLARVHELNLPPGTSRDNPIDAPVGTLQVENGGLFTRLVDLVCAPERFDAAILHINLQNVVSYAPEPAKVIAAFVATAVAAKQRGLFVVLVLRTSGELFLEEYRASAVKLAWESQLAVLPEIEDALRALAAVSKVVSPIVNTEHPRLEEKP
jgi:acyl-CoA synthetase (NDP forming)